MGQRTRNRIREHTGDGHLLARSDHNHAGWVVMKVPADAPKHFWVCVCGWEGWLTDKLDTPE